MYGNRGATALELTTPAAWRVSFRAATSLLPDQPAEPSALFRVVHQASLVRDVAGGDL